MERWRRGRESELDRLRRGYTDIPVLSDCSLAYMYVYAYVGTYVCAVHVCVPKVQCKLRISSGLFS